MKLNDPKLEIHNEGEWNNTHSNYEAYNSGGVEIEVGDYLYGLVRALKPKRVLETGTHWGISASYMGTALKENGFGHLDTYEVYKGNYDTSNERFKTLGIDEYVTCHNEDFRTAKVEGYFQLMFLDTEPSLRFAEMVRMYPQLVTGGFIIIHDLHRHLGENHFPFGEMPQEITDWVKSGRLNVFNLPTPRGFTCFYKVHEDDYFYAPRSTK